MTNALSFMVAFLKLIVSISISAFSIWLPTHKTVELWTLYTILTRPFWLAHDGLGHDFLPPTNIGERKAQKEIIGFHAKSPTFWQVGIQPLTASKVEVNELQLLDRQLHRLIIALVSGRFLTFVPLG